VAAVPDAVPFEVAAAMPVPAKMARQWCCSQAPPARKPLQRRLRSAR
jgi:hypothetical protein